MCGIAGILNFTPESVRLDDVRRMVNVLHHRGPDAQGTHIDGPVGLGHARLSIIDLSGGVQPMATVDRRLWVTFNGEIFNYIELRAELVKRGCRFETQSDTEVILHAYAEYGDDCVSYFNGQWAFAIWDANRQRLFISRDRLGVRPLFYTITNGKFLFGSEIKAIFTCREVKREIDPRGLDQIFTFWNNVPPVTAFKGIRELPPGCSMVVERGNVQVKRYWSLDYSNIDESMDETACRERIATLLSDATRLRLRSDVPVGAYLSGGLDSSLVTALIARTSGARLKTFSVTFDDAEFDESAYQRAVQEHLGTEHESVRCRSSDILACFPEVIWHAEKPVLRTAPAPLYLLARLVRQHGYKVVLTGEGSDEVFGGYDIFKEAKIRRFWAAQPDSKCRPLLLQKLYPYMPNLQAQTNAYRQAFFHVKVEDLTSPFFSHLPRWDLTARLKTFFSADLKAALREYDAYADMQASLPDEYRRWDSFAQAQYLETAGLLPGYILSSQGDRVTMGHSVEGRFPFLDYRVVEFAASIPPRLKMKALNEKYILKQVARDLIPAAVCNRPKQPYRAPDAICFFGEGSEAGGQYVHELLSAERLTQDGLFNPAAVNTLIAKAKQGRIIGVRDNMAVVGILSTQLLVDRYINHWESGGKYGTS